MLTVFLELVAVISALARMIGAKSEFSGMMALITEGKPFGQFRAFDRQIRIKVSTDVNQSD